MEYIYAAMLLHKASKEINEDAVKKILTAAGVVVNEAKVKALVAALEGVNIEEAIKKQAMAVAPVAQAAVADSKAEKKEEKKEEKKDDSAGAAGLGALFG